MIVVIQCAGSKRHDAGRLKTTRGKPVSFVARPDLAPANDSLVYARPDDISDDGRSWREVLLEYNNDRRNPLALSTAFELYREPVYRRLAHELTLQNLYILSAGWGLIHADFLTPDYDITFSQVKPDKKFKQRRKADRYDDLAMIPRDTHDRIIFFGSRSYVPLFCALTQEVRSEKVVFFNAEDPPDAPGCILKEFTHAKRDTNWQYDCANAFLDGVIAV
jgi:hypothetical protein